MSNLDWLPPPSAWQMIQTADANIFGGSSSSDGSSLFGEIQDGYSEQATLVSEALQQKATGTSSSSAQQAASQNAAQSTSSGSGQQTANASPATTLENIMKTFDTTVDTKQDQNLGDGTSIDLSSNTLTESNGTKINLTTGLPITNPDILTLPSGAQINTATGALVNTTA